MKRLILVAFMLISGFTFAQTEGYKVGDVVKDFSLKNVNNKMVALADYKDAKGYIVVFTCNTCPVAKAYQDRIAALNATYAAKGYPVVAINPNDAGAVPDENFQKMQALASEKKLNFPYLLDPDHVVTKQFGATRTPHVFVLNKTDKGNVVEYIGAIDNDPEEANSTKVEYVKNAVNELSIGKKPAIASTKAVGCSIKWKKG
ncbi:thioredoxin family protein [Pedobacter psychrodurus]|uniref:Thioredoxin family protein n=1 Tax=Pedobacter psychrodurus TaxID=2530456 RepID=A0A4R0Q677_9SPHI|nr:thioredoxin family protein [Pedobacter psychrodurus]TCD28245.1 thioredoxin family protein [Pedobacter psychrodurus]